MDALRARNLGCYGYHRNTSPNIDALAKNSAIFTKNFSTNNSTDNSFLSILSGRHLIKDYSATRNQDKKLLSPIFYTQEELKSFFESGGTFLQEILKKNNYKTYCLKYLHGWQKRGFDYYFKENLRLTTHATKDFLEPLRKSKNLHKKIKKLINFKFLVGLLAVKHIKNKAKTPSDEQATNEAIKIIKENKGKQSFFMWIHYMDTHIYYNPDKFLGTFGKQLNPLKWANARYDEAILYNDHLIGKILETLKKEKLFENTIICFLSDHGESLGEHGIYFDHHGLYDVSFNTPLIIHYKGLPSKRINALTQLEDITPTILDLIKIEYDPFIFEGQSLIPLINNKKQDIRETIFMEESHSQKKIALRTKDYKYIEARSKEDALCKTCNKIHGGVLELYDLKKDPEENINIAKENKKLLVEMKTKLDNKIKQERTLNEKRRLNLALSKGNF